MQVNTEVPCSLIVDGSAVTEYTCGGRFAGMTVRLTVLLAVCRGMLLSVTCKLKETVPVVALVGVPWINPPSVTHNPSSPEILLGHIKPLASQ